ncbi:MAG: SagB/ThcOx family dehydrogenase [Candidatus Omnitrophota bacterium]|jgi:SagB-type dehydrogenase family enzyme
MNKKLVAVCCLIFSILLNYSPVHAQQAKLEEFKAIQLLTPQMDGGKPLMQALKERKSSREFSPKELSLQELSNLLWAANGVNRPEQDLTTAPTAMNLQEIEIYVVTALGAYLYKGKNNMLAPITAGDLRAVTGSQPFVADAPINLVFVADIAKMGRIPAEATAFYSATDTGFISQNVYLYCASAGLATVVRAWLDKPALARAMKLRSDQMIILAQTVGYPKE